jgi:hypothetical protein
MYGVSPQCLKSDIKDISFTGKGEDYNGSAKEGRKKTNSRGIAG